MANKTVVLVTRYGFGSTKPNDEAFGIEMFDTFLHTLESRSEKPEAICFYTEGVRLVVEGSPMVGSLRLLEGLGVRLVSCKTCLDHYGLLDRVAVGGQGGMKEIVALMEAADKVVTV